MSVIFEVQVHLATSSLLDQLLRNLTGKQAPQTGSASDKSQLFNSSIVTDGTVKKQPVKSEQHIFQFSSPLTLRFSDTKNLGKVESG